MNYEDYILDHAFDVAYDLGAEIGGCYVGNAGAVRRVVCSYLPDLSHAAQTLLSRADRIAFWQHVADWYERGVQDASTSAPTLENRSTQ